MVRDEKRIHATAMMMKDVDVPKSRSVLPEIMVHKYIAAQTLSHREKSKYFCEN